MPATDPTEPDELTELDAAQRDAWASGAVAVQLDDAAESTGIGDDLLLAARSMGVEAEDRGDIDRAAALHHLLDGEPARLLRAVQVSDDRGARTLVLDFGTAGRGTADHSLLIELDGSRAVAINLAGPDPLGALDDNVFTVDDIAGPELAVLLRAGFAEPMSWHETTRLNQLAAIVRLSAIVPDLRIDLDRPAAEPYVSKPVDAEDNAMVMRVLQASVAASLAAPPPDGWREALRRFGADRPDAVDAVAAAGFDQVVEVSDLERLARVASAYVRPQRLDDFDSADRDAIDGLEWADWLGAIVQLVRSGPGVAVTGQVLVDNINASPEVTTTIPKRDREYIAYAFELTLHAWEASGALDQDGALTEFGAWLLPVGLAIAAGDDDVAARCRSFRQD